MISPLKPPENNYSIAAPGANILLGFYDAQSLKTPRIYDQSVTAPSTLIVLGGKSAQSFETTPK